MDDRHSRAVVLLSGGLDSMTAAAMARAEGYALHALTISYGQRHEVEIRASRRVAEALDVAEHIVAPIDLRLFGGSALTDTIDVPKSDTLARVPEGIPVTYVPARNTIFLALALGYAEVIGAADIFIGVNAVDYSGYPDCRPAFIEAFEKLANLGTKAGARGLRFRIHAPLLQMPKAEIIRRGTSLGIDFALTHSCYDPTPDGLACRFCDSCLLRRKGFEDAGIEDPTRYALSTLD